MNSTTATTIWISLMMGWNTSWQTMPTASTYVLEQRAQPRRG
jgi:hypothetical protein